MATWTRTHGPDETFECGDVEYEMGSTYDSDDGMRVVLTYFVEAFPNGDDPESYGIRYKCETYAIGNEDNPVVAYDWASALAYDTLESAVAKCKSYAVVDESGLFD